MKENDADTCSDDHGCKVSTWGCCPDELTAK